MKMLKIMPVLAITAYCILLFLNSCEKAREEQLILPVQNLNEITQNDLQVYQRILEFKKKSCFIKQNPHFKSGETVSIDSAIWYLDASVNFTHAYTFESFEEYYTDSVFLDIPINSGEIDMNDLSESYYEMVALIKQDVYNDVQEQDKQLYSSSLIVASMDENKITLKNKAIIGSKGIAPGSENPFDTDWEYGELNGSCTNNFLNSDAIHKICDATITNKPLYIIDEGNNWHAFYTGPEKEVNVYAFKNYEVFPGSGNLLLNPEDPNPNDNYRDRLLFFQNVENGALEECISAPDMNFYYHSAHQIIYNIIPENASVIEDWNGVQGLTFYGITDKQGWYLTSTNYKEKLYHYIRILYKTRHVVYDDEYPIPL